MTKKVKIIILSVSGFLLTVGLVVAIPFAIMGGKTASMNKKYDYLKTDTTHSNKVEVTGLNLVMQHISCGYATIEMLSEYYGNKITEDQLSEKNNGSISTSSSSGFLKEINRSIDKTFTKKTYLANDEFLKTIHTSLFNNNPVAIEWAAKDTSGVWTLHFSVVSGLDLANDNVTIYNPYGYIENIDINTFINRTTFKAYKNMPGFLAFGFAFGAFDKNALFYVK